MSFSSIDFIFKFFPLFLVGYYITPAKFRMYTMLAGSIIFYLLSVPLKPLAILLPFFSILLAYQSARYIVTRRGYEKQITFASVFILFAILMTYKYVGLFTDVPIIVPAGISFYTFQLTAYLFDVYRKKVRVEKSILKFAAGMLMFPKFLSGPITPWKDIEPQLSAPKYSITKFDLGLRTFIHGLSMKVLLADRIGGLWKQAQDIGFESISTQFAWLAILSYSLKLYYDFYGYSLMAKGAGAMLGYNLPMNFLHPYSARSMSAFWKKWHVTLGNWFAEYIYIPLGGNRLGIKRQIINLGVVWLCTSLWHGSTFNFILWGTFIFIIIVAEKLLKIDRNDSPLSHLYMIPAILISWTFFAITDLSQLGIFFSKLFPFFTKNTVLFAGDYILYGKQYAFLLIIGCILSFPGPAKFWKKIRATNVGTVILFIAFWLCIYCLSSGLNDPFMYFSF